MNRAILLSGGMDSIALAYWKKPEIAITVDYGQIPAEAEIRVSRIIADSLGIEHHILKVDCSQLGSGDLSDTEAIELAPSSEWWPFRNQLLITLASMKAVKLNVKEIMTASVKTDGFHKDGTKVFYDFINSLSVYQEGAIAITAPCIDLTTAELINLSGVTRDILLWAHSCHKSNIACGKCRGCNKYSQVMVQMKYV